MDSQIIDLSRLPAGCLGTVISINSQEKEKDRFIDLGFAPSRKVKTLFKSPAQNPIAYEVMGAVLALRSEDASKIMIRTGSQPL